MDRAAIFTELTERNALRREAGLPLIDMRREFDRAVALERWREWEDTVARFADLREAIRQDVLSEYRAQGRTMDSVGGRWLVRTRADREFEEVLRQRGFCKPPLPTRHPVAYGKAAD
jgi:hypothetical protein